MCLIERGKVAIRLMIFYIFLLSISLERYLHDEGWKHVYVKALNKLHGFWCRI